MFRINKVEERLRTIVTLDGQFSGDCIEAVEACCAQAMSAGKPVDLFLRDVLAIDKAGRALLRRLASNGIRLLASGVYTSYVVKVSTSADPADASIGKYGPQRS